MILRFTILAFLLPLILAQTSPSPSGLTFDLCTHSSDCAPPRICTQSELSPQCSSDATHPSCLRCIPPQGFYACTTINDCPSNESCFANPHLPALVCMSNAEGPAAGGKSVGDSDQSRVTLDVCSIDQDCAGERLCKFLSQVVSNPCENQTTCKCLTTVPVTCLSSDTCDPGEICAHTTELGNICVSDVVANEAGVPRAEESANDPPGSDTPTLPPPNQPTSPPSTDIPIVTPPEQTTSPLPSTGYTPRETSADTPNEPNQTARPGPPPSRNGTNLVLENCRSDEDCLTPRKCLSFSNDTAAGNPSCGASATCICGFKPIPPCESDDECNQGEVCSLAGGTSFETCISQAVIDAFADKGSPLPGTQDTPEPSASMSEEPNIEEGVCMDATLLSHLSRRELVFSTHRRARVLCDKFGSCATAGHMVKHLGIAMMMRSYCAKVGCSKAFMEVNSPRRRRGTLVPSRTKGLVLTAFAARYATSLEEATLRVVIKMAL